ncbi:MAG TPA: PDZ domain-containing protein, partial [Xanthomonadales bacterium]|nr:PDZ domain-containing protein [Xanthomonadales bacterium]
RSAEMASFDTWIKQYKPDANTVNSVVSYYRKGSLIGFVADTAIRGHTRNQASLDTLMRKMYRRYGPDGSLGEGYPPGAFEEMLEELGGAQARQSLEKVVTSTADPEIDAALAWYGLSLDRNPARTAAQAVGDEIPVGFGLIWDKTSTELVVESVLQGGSGAEAGILPADEILALNNTRVNRDTIADRFIRLGPGEAVNVTLARHGKLMNLVVLTQEAVPAKYEMLIDPKISRRQKERMSEWLGVTLKFINN